MTDRETQETIRRVLDTVRTIAVIGFSDDPQRESNDVARFLLAHGYDVMGVNPKLAGQKVNGIAVYARLADVPGPVDMVDVFRRSEFLDEIIRSAVALKDEKSLRAIWLQLGLTHPVAEAFARARGLDVISDRCPKIELKRERITT